MWCGLGELVDCLVEGEIARLVCHVCADGGIPKTMPPSFSPTIRIPTFPISCHTLSLWEEYHCAVSLR